MKINKYDILFQEVPNEISLGFYVVGCGLRCKGCHSIELWDTSTDGLVLDETLFLSLLDKYIGYISCILFLGGEWEASTLIRYLELAKAKNLKTALYTGQNQVSSDITDQLDFMKIGPWVESLGGLGSLRTNQEFWDLNQKTKMNHLFTINNEE